MAYVVSSLEQVTPEWLTNIMQQLGIISMDSAVTSVEITPTAAFNSHALHLVLSYGTLDGGSITRNLLLKFNRAQPWAKRAGARESAFYQMVGRLPDHPAVVVRCFDAVYDEASGNSHILLEDLSATHEIAVEREQQIALANNLPSMVQLSQVITALAKFHAYWWGKTPHAVECAHIGWGCGNEQSVAKEIERSQQALSHLITQAGDWFPTRLTSMYERILERRMALWRTYMEPKVGSLANLTLTHGDAYLANVLCPRAGYAGNTYLIDWQGPEVYRGTSDLVTMCATFWTRKQRAAGERELRALRQYHRTLLENGIDGYAWDDLIADYRYSIVDWVLVPLQDCLDGAGRAYWWPKMQCLAEAYEDWNCGDL